MVTPKTMVQEFGFQAEKGFVSGQASGAKGDPLVICVHGWSQRNGWHTWKPLLGPLGSAGYYVISVDMPGWGRSSAWYDEPLTITQAVRCLILIADNIEEDHVVLMGKSWGGGVAIQTALDHTDRVAGLILTAPVYLEIDRLTEIRQPVLLAWAEDDPVIPVKYAETFHESIETSELVLYETGGHSAAPANHADFAPKAIRFLQSIFGKGSIQE